MSALSAMSADARQEPLDNARIRYLDADTAINENKLMRQRQMYDAMGTVTSNPNPRPPRENAPRTVHAFADVVAGWQRQRPLGKRKQPV